MNKAVFRENLKRFWPISLAALICYFMAGPFIMLQSDPYYSSSINSAVSMNNIAYLFITCVLTVAIGAGIHGYLFRVNSSAFMHAAPLSRRTLFFTNAGSGLVLAFAPSAGNALILLALKFSGIFDSFINIGAEFTEVTVFTVPGILKWLILTWVEIFFSYAVCSLSAYICGNGVINVLTSCGLNLLPTLVVLSAFPYSTCFLFGFDDASVKNDLVLQLHPVLSFSRSNSWFITDKIDGRLPEALIFIAAALIIFAAAFLAYKKRPNEKAGDSYVFDWVNIVICVLMVYMGASAIGLLSYDGMCYWGFAAGWLFTFLVGQMIIQMTVRIFNRKLLKAAIACAAVMVLVISVFALDLTGFEKRVPQPDKVERVEFYESGSLGGSCSLTEKESIADFTEVHRRIVENRDSLRNWMDPGWENEVPVAFRMTYRLKSGREICRYYWIPRSFLEDIGEFERMYYSKEVLSIFDSLSDLSPEDTFVTFELYGEKWGYAEDSEVSLSQKYDVLSEDEYCYEKFTDEEKMLLAQAVYSDIKRLGFGNNNSLLKPTYYYIRFEIEHPLEGWMEYANEEFDYQSKVRFFRYGYNPQGKRDRIYEILSLNINEDFTETIKTVDEILKGKEKQ